MTPPFSPSLLGDALDYLTGLATNDVNPAMAREHLDRLRERHPGTRLRLVWQREEYDDSLQYDLLIAGSGGEVVSLAYCPDRTLPWSLRGGHRVSERLLLRVNGIPLEINQAIACLDLLEDESPMADRLVTACLLRQAIEEEPVVLSDEQLQTALDAFRRARGLLTAAATDEWMARRGLTHSSLERIVAAEAAVAVLRQRETATQIPAYFEAHRHELATARFARIVSPTPEVALGVIREIQSGADFFAVAERSFLGGRLVPSTGLFCRARRDELAESIARQVFAASPGTTLGPFAADDGYAIVRVIALEDAVLDADTAALIEHRLFARWLDTRRQSARVEWFWGSPARARGVGLDARAESPS